MPAVDIKRISDVTMDTIFNEGSQDTTVTVCQPGRERNEACVRTKQLLDRRESFDEYSIADFSILEDSQENETKTLKALSPSDIHDDDTISISGRRSSPPTREQLALYNQELEEDNKSSNAYDDNFVRHPMDINNIPEEEEEEEEEESVDRFHSNNNTHFDAKKESSSQTGAHPYLNSNNHDVEEGGNNNRFDAKEESSSQTGARPYLNSNNHDVEEESEDQRGMCFGAKPYEYDTKEENEKQSRVETENCSCDEYDVNGMADFDDDLQGEEGTNKSEEESKKEAAARNEEETPRRHENSIIESDHGPKTNEMLGFMRKLSTDMDQMRREMSEDRRKLIEERSQNTKIFKALAKELRRKESRSVKAEHRKWKRIVNSKEAFDSVSKKECILFAIKVGIGYSKNLKTFLNNEAIKTNIKRYLDTIEDSTIADE